MCFFILIEKLLLFSVAETICSFQVVSFLWFNQQKMQKR